MPGEEAATVAGAVALSMLAILVAHFATAFARRTADYVVLAAGLALVLVTTFHLMPEAVSMSDIGVITFVGGCLLGVVLDLGGKVLSRPGAKHDISRIAMISLVVLGVHSMVDGTVYSTAFAHDEMSGRLASIGLILHEAPEGVIALILAGQIGLRPVMAILVAVFASSITTAIGWGLTHIDGVITEPTVSVLFPVSAGLLFYVGARLTYGGWRAILRARTTG